jgi:hypothetical protein
MKSDSLREYCMQEAIIEVLIDVCPKESLNRCASILPSVTGQIFSLEQLVNELGAVPNVGQTSHPIRQMRDLIHLGDRFRDFTRDYIRRCCDLIEDLTKSKLAPVRKVNVKKLSLGPAIRELERSGLSDDLVEKLIAFNTKVYTVAKHEMPREDRHMYSVADAVAVTLVCLDLAREISSHISSVPQIAP